MPMATPEEQREYQRKWIAKRREEFFKDKECVDCGSKVGLQLDHIDRAKKIDHKIWSWSLEKRNKELLECQILCSTCHYDKTYSELGYGRIKHGTTTKYSYGCRCDRCKGAHRLDMRKYRSKK